MAEKNSKLFPIILLVAFVLLGGGLFLAMLNERTEEFDTMTTNTMEDVADNIEETEEMAEDGSAAIELGDNDVDPNTLTESELNEDAMASIDMETALSERILGNPNAAIKISEHSSFSCGHCGNFHQNVFDEFKADWIDTGKAYLVFSDFPLNAPALHASLVGRCITNDENYFDYVKEVFAEQQNWAFQSDHLAPLKAIAANYGISDDEFRACIQNEELQAGLLAKVRAAQQQFNVSSTPSFVVNNAVTITGAMNYEDFNTILENAVAESVQSDDEAPAETE